MQKPIEHTLLVTFYCLALVANAFAETSSIGALAELTGNFARFGEDCRRGYEIAQANSSSTARVLFGDNQSDPKAAISEFHRLVTSERASILVTSRSPVGLALNPLSNQQHIPLIGIVGHPRFVSENPYAVRVFPSAGDEAAALAGYVESKGESKIAAISLEDEYFIGLRNEFEKKIGKDKIVFSETVAPSEQDFSSLLVRIKSKYPTAILANVGPAQMAQLITKIHQTGLNVRVYSNFLAGSADIRKALGENGEGVVFAELDYDKPEFLKAVAKRADGLPLSPLGYSCYVALKYAFELDRVSRSRTISLSQALLAIDSVDTLDGPVVFAGREAKFRVVPKMIRNGVNVTIE